MFVWWWNFIPITNFWAISDFTFEFCLWFHYLTFGIYHRSHRFVDLLNSATLGQCLGGRYVVRYILHWIWWSLLHSSFLSDKFRSIYRTDFDFTTLPWWYNFPTPFVTNHVPLIDIPRLHWIYVRFVGVGRAYVVGGLIIQFRSQFHDRPSSRFDRCSFTFTFVVCSDVVRWYVYVRFHGHSHSLSFLQFHSYDVVDSWIFWFHIPLIVDRFPSRVRPCTRHVTFYG